MYKVVYLESAADDLMSIDKPVRKRLMDRIDKNLAAAPKALGKPLTGHFAGLWRYRVGDYRVIYKIAEKEILIMVARIGHRRSIYR